MSELAEFLERRKLLRDGHFSQVHGLNKPQAPVCDRCGYIIRLAVYGSTDKPLHWSCYDIIKNGGV